MMNPETNKFEQVNPKCKEYEEEIRSVLNEHEKRYEKLDKYNSVELVRSDGSPIPKDYPIFSVGEEFVLNNYRFRVKEIREDELVLAPNGPMPKTRTIVMAKKGKGRSQKKRKSGSQKKR